VKEKRREGLVTKQSEETSRKQVKGKAHSDVGKSARCATRVQGGGTANMEKEISRGTIRGKKGGGPPNESRTAISN